MVAHAYVCGCAGVRLTPEERALFRKTPPWGLIIFTRNIEDPPGLRNLTQEFREVVGREDAPVFVDQEGGNVQRMGPPWWRSYPAAAELGRSYDRRPERALAAQRGVAGLLARDLRQCGVTVNCAPVADMAHAGASSVIGARAYGRDPHAVAQLAQAACEGFSHQGVAPVVKHIPGHGRAPVDSHIGLPRVSTGLAALDKTDFAPFRQLRHWPAAMTAHVIYEAIDPQWPATVSAKVIDTVIRGCIGFDGLLVTDDLSMGALHGGLGQRARASLEAGCDMALHCNGTFREMVSVAAACPPLAGRSLERADGVLALINAFDKEMTGKFDEAAALAALQEVSGDPDKSA